MKSPIFSAALLLLLGAAASSCNRDPPPATAAMTPLRDDSASIHAPPSSPDHATANAFAAPAAAAKTAPLTPLREGNPGAPSSIAACADDWLSRHHLNEYGDPPGTMYPGATPLFNERTGVKTDRFAYLFAKNPQLRADCAPPAKEAEAPAGNPY